MKPLQKDDVGVDIPSTIDDLKFWKLVLVYQFVYSLIGLATAVLCLGLGMLLFINGVGSGASWTAKFLGFEISDAAPGIVLFLVGALIQWLTRFNVKISRTCAPPSTPKSPTPSPLPGAPVPAPLPPIS